MITARIIAKALGARKSGTSWMACCPAHKDRSPSLSITSKGGRVLVKCFAGCSQESVIGELRKSGLWHSVPCDNSSREAAITTVYSYVDHLGIELYQVCRIEPGPHGKKKHFLQRYCDGGRVVWKKHPNQVLYRLPEVIASSIVFLVEGEKDCEILREHGFVATTNAGGSEAPWLPEYTAALRGREVIAIPDGDMPGRRRVLRIARHLVAQDIRLFVLDLGEESKDITDWFDAGHSEVELIGKLNHSEGEA